jgi:protein PhnA
MAGFWRGTAFFSVRFGLIAQCDGMEARNRTMDVRDCNGAILNEGDTVQVIKDLKVKGTSSTLKRGTVIKGIHLTDDPALVECRVAAIKGLVLRTEFLKKA